MAQQLIDYPSLWIERLARFGYASKGVVYGIVGLLAAQAAFGTGGKTTDTQGALQTLVEQPFGQLLLALVAIGLIGYVLWRFVQAIKDPENKGKDAKGLAQRIGYAINGFIYAGLAFSAVQILLGSGNSGNSNSTEDSTARLLSQPFGQWLVGTVGALIIGLGFYQFYNAFSAKFRRELNLTQLSDAERKWVISTCRFGLLARGIVFCIIGWFLIQAGTQYDAKAAGGLDEALQSLAQQPYGPWLLGIVALGLVAYGIYMIVKARYSQLVVH
ncbi:MAG: DUF1206 domain-containing protein [Mojavia pulchra JT2-VF2]|jgi:uncharacterized membrane protein YidH (DUF202 family)|uniref:DUF1206 domain-containing protein n=1 Tax=Mojavia pulchra JT2-VF2 TaxID=287848 RepID=A0A951PVH6_9NOST|nr:DUF1206 domain-containing protein [Mojavia pulchra JT2-VF2]